MTEFIPSKIDLDSINNGKLYKNGDGVQAETLNDVVRSVAYAQSLATNQPDVSEADNYGTPSVSIVEVENGVRLKFSNLKGADGKDHTEDIYRLQEQIDDLYLLSNTTVTGTETVTSEEPFNERVTAEGLNIIDGALTRVEKVYGSDFSGSFIGISSTSQDGKQEDSMHLSNYVDLGLYDSIDMNMGITYLNTGVVEKRGCTDIISTYNKDGSQKDIVALTGDWARDGWFGFYMFDGINKTAAPTDEVYNGKKRTKTDIIEGFQNGEWQWFGATFTENERYAICGNKSKIFYCIMPNADLGVLQDATNEEKIEAVRSWFANNSTYVRYLAAKELATTETVEFNTNKYQAWVGGTERISGSGKFSTTQTYAVMKGVEQ